MQCSKRYDWLSQQSFIAETLFPANVLPCFTEWANTRKHQQETFALRVNQSLYSSLSMPNFYQLVVNLSINLFFFVSVWVFYITDIPTSCFIQTYQLICFGIIPHSLTFNLFLSLCSSATTGRNRSCCPAIPAQRSNQLSEFSWRALTMRIEHYSCSNYVKGFFRRYKFRMNIILYYSTFWT